MPTGRKSIEAINPDDFIALVERIVSGAEGVGQKRTDLPTWVVRYLINLAKRAPKTGRGRNMLRRYEEMADYLAIESARQHKAKLVAGGMRKEKAASVAAEEASAALGRRGRNLAPSTVKRRMEGRK